MAATAPPPVEALAEHRRATLRGLDSCTTMAELRQYHSQVVRMGLGGDNDAAGRLLRFLALRHPTSSSSSSAAVNGDHHLHYALRLFRSLPSPDPFVYHVLFRANHSSHHHPLHLYALMLSRSVSPTAFTYPSLLPALSSARAIEPGRQLHAHVLKLGFLIDTATQNALIHLYLSCGRPSDARRAFDTMPQRDVVSWTTMITGYSRLGMLNEAREVFDAMPERNSISWNAMIAGYVQGGRFKEAFELFGKMRAEGVAVDKFVAASMLSACTGLGALEQGKWIHAHIERRDIELDARLATTVMDMYCKCGCLEKALEVFHSLPSKEVSSWNCMIGGLATHGRGVAAIELFQEMEKERVTPDGITLLNVLTACAHTGLVSEGRYYFEHIVKVCGVKPKMEHFGCLVDLLGRAGMFDDAKKVIDEMPMEADAGVLGALLGACKIHGNVTLGEEIGRRVIELDPNNSGRYVLLANLFAAAGRWDEVADIRKLMNDRAVIKEPGCSMIEFEGEVSEFIAGGRTHPQAREIYAKVDEMLGLIRLEGYKPDVAGLLHDVNEDEKDNPLYYHSEKLAIAFGLLHSDPGDTIRISKNLRVCRDCHEVSKLISRAYNREIIVRDRSRFHHFKGGECSCKDYW